MGEWQKCVPKLVHRKMLCPEYSAGGGSATRLSAYIVGCRLCGGSIKCENFFLPPNDCASFYMCCWLCTRTYISEDEALLLNTSSMCRTYWSNRFSWILANHSARLNIILFWKLLSTWMCCSRDGVSTYSHATQLHLDTNTRSRYRLYFQRRTVSCLLFFVCIFGSLDNMLKSLVKHTRELQQFLC